MDRRRATALLLGAAASSLLRAARPQECGAACYPRSSGAFDSGAAAVKVQPGRHASGLIKASATLKLVSGSGVLQQAAGDQDLLVFDGNTNLRIEGLHFLGASGTGQPSTASGNSGLILKNARGVVITGCSFERFRFYGLYLEHCSDVVIASNSFYQNASPLRLRGCERVTIANNIVLDTCLAPHVFTVGIGLDSTDGHSFGICRDILIRGNRIGGMNNAQGILVHAGEGVSIADNAIVGTAIPISCNPFNLADSIKRLSIVGNTLDLPARGTFTNANDGIVVQGGPGTPDPTDITIAANRIESANRVMQNPGMGAIRVGYSRGAIVTGNVISRAYRNGIVLTSSDAVVTGNQISDIAGRKATGIAVTGPGQRVIRDNLFRNVRNVYR